MDPLIATIQLFALNFAPVGWMVCDGTVLQISQYTALFALIGTTYGGNGTATFAIPNLKGKSPVDGAEYCICVQGVFPQRP